MKTLSGTCGFALVAGIVAALAGCSQSGNTGPSDPESTQTGASAIATTAVAAGGTGASSPASSASSSAGSSPSVTGDTGSEAGTSGGSGNSGGSGGALGADLPLSSLAHGDKYTDLFNGAIAARANACLTGKGQSAVFEVLPAGRPRPPVNHLAGIGIVSAVDPSQYGQAGAGANGTKQQVDPANFEGMNLPQPAVDALSGDGGCLEVAAREVQEQALNPFVKDIPEPDRNVLAAALSETNVRAAADGGVVAASERWVKCVTDRGFRGSSPAMGVEGRSGGDSLLDADRLEAMKLDVECKQESGLIDVFVSSLRGAQEQVMAADGEKIKRVFAAEEQQMAAFAKIING